MDRKKHADNLRVCIPATTNAVDNYQLYQKCQIHFELNSKSSCTSYTPKVNWLLDSEKLHAKKCAPTSTVFEGRRDFCSPNVMYYFKKIFRVQIYYKKSALHKKIVYKLESTSIISYVVL